MFRKNWQNNRNVRDFNNTTKLILDRFSSDGFDALKNTSCTNKQFEQQIEFKQENKLLRFFHCFKIFLIKYCI